MSDEEQIRLLTEIRDVLKEQTAWAREATKRRVRVAFIMMAILFAFLAYFTYITIVARNHDQQDGQEQARPQSVALHGWRVTSRVLNMRGGLAPGFDLTESG